MPTLLQRRGWVGKLVVWVVQSNLIVYGGASESPISSACRFCFTYWLPCSKSSLGGTAEQKIIAPKPTTTKHAYLKSSYRSRFKAKAASVGVPQPSTAPPNCPTITIKLAPHSGPSLKSKVGNPEVPSCSENSTEPKADPSYQTNDTSTNMIG